MDGENFCNKQTFASIVKTILLFLENNNLKQTVEIFCEEIEKKFPGVRLNDVQPRTVILRPMDIATNVDATISDENLIICISGKNIEANSAGFRNTGQLNNAGPNENSALELLSETTTTINSEDLNATPPPSNFREDYGDYNAISSNDDVEVYSKNRILKESPEMDYVNLTPSEMINPNNNANKHPIANNYDNSMKNSYGDINYTSKQNPYVGSDFNTAETVDETNKPENYLYKQNSFKKSQSKSASPTRISQNVNVQNPVKLKRPKSHPIPCNALQIKQNGSEEMRQMIGNQFKTKLFEDEKRLAPYKIKSCEEENGGVVVLAYPNNENDMNAVSVGKLELHEEIPVNDGHKINSSNEQTIIHNPTSDGFNKFNNAPYAGNNLNNYLTKPRNNSVPNSPNLNKANYNNNLIEECNGEVSENHYSGIKRYVSMPPQEPPVVKDCATIVEPMLKKSCASMSVKRANMFCPLNYGKIKRDLMGSTCEVKLKILQALRWRLTRTDTKIRDHNLMCYVAHDLLDINEGSDFFEQYFNLAKDCNSRALQEESSRFINTLASMSMGREYLEKCPNIVEILLPTLTAFDDNEKINFQNLTRQFVMATIQKLSLSAQIRKRLINEGIVEWLVKYMLKYHEVMTDYEAEYSVALFSNLCIHRTMRELCEISAEDTAKLLNVLVYTPHKCCLPYLSGILGSLLTCPTINKRAAELNMRQKLQYLAQCAGDEETRHQLEFIIQLHDTSSQCSCMYDVIEEPQIYSDYLECELGMRETNYCIPVGEKFLENYSTTCPALEKHVNVVKRTCSYGVHQTSDHYKLTSRSNHKKNEVLTEHPPAANKPLTKADIFKDLFDQVHSLSPASVTAVPLTPQFCRLSFQNLSRPVCALVGSSAGITKGKYSCACYEEIKGVYLDAGDLASSSGAGAAEKGNSVQNSGRKANNVVYGPLVTPKHPCSTLSLFPCGLKECCT